MGLNVLPGDPIEPGGPGGPGWPSDPVTGGPGGPRAPGIPGIPDSPCQSKHKGHMQSDHSASIWAGSLNHCAFLFLCFCQLVFCFLSVKQATFGAWTAIKSRSSR